MELHSYTTRSYRYFSPLCDPVDPCDHPLRGDMLDFFEPTDDYLPANNFYFNEEFHNDQEKFKSFIQKCGHDDYYQWHPEEGKTCRQGSYNFASEVILTKSFNCELKQHARCIPPDSSASITPSPDTTPIPDSENDTSELSPPISAFNNAESNNKSGRAGPVYSLNTQLYRAHPEVYNLFTVKTDLCISLLPFFVVNSMETVERWQDKEAHLCSGGAAKQHLMDAIRTAAEAPGKIISFEYQITLGTKPFTHIVFIQTGSELISALYDSSDMIFIISPTEDADGNYTLTLPSTFSDTSSGNKAFIGMIHEDKRPVIHYKGEDSDYLFELGGHVHSENIEWQVPWLSSNAHLFLLPAKKTLFDFNSSWQTTVPPLGNSSATGRVLHASVYSDVYTSSSPSDSVCTLQFGSHFSDSWSFPNTYKSAYESTCSIKCYRFVA